MSKGSREATESTVGATLRMGAAERYLQAKLLLFESKNSSRGCKND